MRSFAVACALLSLAADDYDRPPIRYSETAPDDAVTTFGRELRTGAVALPRDEAGTLRAVLKRLDVPVSSQVLAFSKTSLQRSLIGPKTPRAIYFNDDVAVAFCQGGDTLELVADDPDLGAVYSTLDRDPAGRAAVTRQTDRCLSCHAGSANQNVPGFLARSVSVDAAGEMLLARGTKRVDASTPFAERWGGWYVTGTSGKQSHRGNAVITAAGVPSQDGTNVTDLRPDFDTRKYPSPHSDLVALMVLEHQGEAHNRLTRANYATRVALAEEADINAALGLPAGARAESIARRIVWACEPVVEALLFADEAPLTGAVAGTSEFAAEFAARGPFDAKGRSLRQLDLKTRMFRTPLSYVVYSRHFDGLPPEAKAQVYRRLWEVLTGKDRTKPFAHLTDADRLAALEMLRATKPGLPGYWGK